MKKHIYFLMIWFLSSEAYSSNQQYSIYVDAGSNGSRLHIYQYSGTLSHPIIRDIYNDSVKPGISSFVDHPEDVGESLRVLFDKAEQLLKDKQIENVPLNILGTGGMRLLSEEKQIAIYKNICDVIKKHYSFEVKNIKTISGEMEGVYGWLDVNYLQGNFYKSKSTVGSLDMGGASTQISFDTNKYDGYEAIQLNIGKKEYYIYSKSFLGLGEDQAREKVKNEPFLYSCYPENYILNENTIGNFNMPVCSDIFSRLIKNNKVENIISLINDKSFIAHSGFYKIYNFFDSVQSTNQSLFE